jgi:GNAT superfamily N-acetyltransferase
MRIAEMADAPRVARLIAAFRDYYEEDEPSDEVIHRVVRRLIRGGEAEFLMAGEPACGVAQLRYRTSVWTGSLDCWLEDLFIERDARGGGIGRRLVEACIERARQQGCQRIQLDCNERNHNALSLYEAVGFSSRTERWQGGRDLYLTRRLDDEPPAEQGGES